MDLLDAEADALVAEGYRPGTKKNLSTQAQTYYQFCDKYKLNPFPATSRQLLRFVTFLHVHKHLKPDTIGNYIAGVRTLHELLEITPPSHSYVLKTIIKGLKARDKVPCRQAAPIDPDIFCKLYPHVNFQHKLEMVAWVALLMGFHLLLRASNITSASRFRFDPSINLTCRDFRMQNDIMPVHIKWTKTLQYKEKKLLIPVISFTKPGLSAVKWFQHMIACIPAGPDEPAFSVPDKGVNLPLSYSQLSRLLKEWAIKARLDPRRYSLHCLRRGGACWLDTHGVPDRVIQVLGDWKSQAFKLYIDSALHTRLQAMTAFANIN